MNKRQTELIKSMELLLKEMKENAQKEETKEEPKPLEYKGEAEFLLWNPYEVTFTMVQTFSGLDMYYHEGLVVVRHDGSQKVTPILKPIPEGTTREDLVGEWIVGGDDDNEPYLVYEKNKAVYYDSNNDCIQFTDPARIVNIYALYTLELP
jgi:hypothetical protein